MSSSSTSSSTISNNKPPSTTTTTTIDGVIPDLSTSESLGKLLSDFDTFEGVLRNGTRQRRERDEARVADLRQIITSVEIAVNQESERRREASKALQSWAETQVLSVRTRIEEHLSASHNDILQRIAALNDRVTSLEKQFQKDKLDVLEEIDIRNKTLLAALKTFHEEFEAEKKSRLEREQKIMDRLGMAEHEAIALWETERSIRENIYMNVKKQLEEAIENRTKIDSKFQSSIFTELSAIKNGITAEAEAREAEDDALARSLQTYVSKLQASLALINSTDTDF